VTALRWLAVEGSDWGDDEPYRPPLPPEDRLWRHPSEMAGAVAPAAATSPGGRGRRTAIVVAVGAAGALLVAGLADVALRPADVASPATTVPLVPATTVPLSTTAPAPPTSVSAPTSAPVTPTTVGAATVTTMALRPDVPGLLRLVATTPDGDRAAAAVAIDAQGTLVTSVAAVRDATVLVVVLPDGTAAAAEVMGIDGEAGAAVLVVAAPTTPARAGKAGRLVVGDQVATAWPARTTGTVQDLGVDASARSGQTMRHLLALEAPDAAAFAEGEALLDGSGSVVGLCTRDADGRLLAVPIELARSAARSWRQEGRLVIPWIGVGGRDADGGGAHLKAVDADGPAATAGVLEGDTVRAVDGEAVASMAAFVLAVRDHDAGSVVTLTVERDGAPMELSVTVAERPTQT
jgi:S1-C subfamily serine protease